MWSKVIAIAREDFLYNSVDFIVVKSLELDTREVFVKLYDTMISFGCTRDAVLYYYLVFVRFDSYP